MPQLQPDWHRLIVTWIACGRYGLTLPFLVGARELVTKREMRSRDDVHELLVEIIEHPVPDHAVFARWCDDIESVVLASYATTFPYRPKANLIEYRPRRGADISFAVEKTVAHRLGVGSTATELLTALLDYAAPSVVAGKFSRYWTIEGRESGPLQTDDIQFIESTLAESAG